MKAALVLAANLVLSLVRLGLADECHNICADVKKGVNFKSGCSAFRNSLPRPKVSSTCQSAFKAAVDLNCYDACTNGGHLQPFVSESRMNEACKRAVRETPRPLCHDACVRGYRSGVKDMTTLLVKRMTEGTPKVLAALKKDTSARQKVAQRAHVVAPSAEPSAAEETAKPIASANSKVTPSSRMVGPGVSGAELLDAEVTEPVEGNEPEPHQPEEVENLGGGGGETEPQEPDEVENLDAIAGKTEEGHVVDEEPPVSAGEIDEVNQEVEDEINSAANVDGEIGEPHKAENDEEDIYKWIEDEAKVLLSLPITVDNVEKELTIFEGDEPMDVVLEFCRDNMPGEAGCADQLIGVVVDKISPRNAQEE